MEIRNLITFTKVAEAQSLSGAAKQLGYAQSTVTMQMQQLEQEVGVPLYERVGRRIRITQAGEALLAYAVPIIRMSEAALRIGKEEAAEPEGILRLGVSEAMKDETFVDVLAQFADRYPRVQLDIRSAVSSQELVARLLHNEIDMAMILDRYLADTALMHGYDERETLCFAVPPGHALTKKTAVSRGDILGTQLIRGDSGGALEQELTAALASGQTETAVPASEQMETTVSASVQTEKAGGPPLTVSDLGIALEMAARGRGIVLAPERMARRYIEERRLERLRCDWFGTEFWRQTVYHRNKWRTGAMNAWIKTLEDTK